MLQRFAAMGMGGVLAGTQAAINDSWPKAHGFLHRNLDAGDNFAASTVRCVWRCARRAARRRPPIWTINSSGARETGSLRSGRNVPLMLRARASRQYCAVYFGSESKTYLKIPGRSRS
jgi:hypothetical protein